MRTWTLALAGSVLLLSSSVRARADGVISDSLTVYDPTGAVAYTVSVDEATENAAQIYYIDVANLVDITQFSHPTVLLETATTQSDIFGVASFDGGKTGVLAFQSDTDNASPNIETGGAIVLPEGNGVFDATSYLNPNLRASGWTATFISDAVPEPGSMASFGGALMALLALGRQRLKK